MFKQRISLSIGMIIGLYLLLAGAYSLASPIFEAPDELQHVYFVTHLAATHQLPRLAADEQALYGQEGGQPPLYYAVGALLISGLETHLPPPEKNPHANVGNPLLPGNKNIVIHHSDEAWPWHGMPLIVHLLRFFSILLGAGTLFFIWQIVRTLFPSSPHLALAATALVAFLPQFLFISAAVSNDNLITFLSTLVLWIILRCFGPTLQRAPHWDEALVLGIFLGLAALSKLSGLNLWLLVGVAYLIHLLMQRDVADVLPAILLTALAALALAAPWYWRNWQLYGDPTGLNAFLAIVGPRTTPIHPRTEFQGLRISLLGLFGWFNIPLPELIYHLWDAFLAISAIGFLQGVWRRRWRLRPLRRYAFLLLLGLWLGLIGLSLIRWISLTPGAQGRLLFPAIVSLSLLLMLGWREWLPAHPRWLAIPPLLLLATSLYSVIWVIPAAYRPPETISPAAIPATARREPIIFDGRIMLVGAEASPATVHPGEPLQITLYWQAVDAIPYQASLYIHILGRDFTDVAQINSYPGSGAAPTRSWQPNQVLVDHYQVLIPGGITVPTRLLIDVGLYDYATQTPYTATLASGETPPLGVAAVRALPATPPELSPAHPTDFRADNLLRLAGYDLPETILAPGATLPLTLYWQGLAPIDEDYQVFVHLIDATGQQVAGFDKTPLDGWWPTSLWEPGQTFADHYPLRLPDDLPPGSYQLRAGLYRLRDFYRLPLSGPSERIIDNAAVLTNLTIQP